MKRNTRLFCIALIAILMGAGEWQYWNMRHALAPITEYYQPENQKQSGLNAMLLEEQAAYGFAVTGQTLTAADISVHSGKGPKVWISHVDSAFQNVYQLEMERGAFSFGEENSVVIGQDLAYQLFRSYDVVNYPVYVNGSLYLISGVYRQSNDIASKRAKSLEVVYLPQTSEETMLSRVSVRGGKEPDYYRAAMGYEASDALKDWIGISLPDEFAYAALPRFFVWLALLLVLLGFLLRWVLKKGKRYVDAVRKALAEQYFWQAVRRPKKEILFLILSLIAFGAVFVVLYQFLSGFYLPSYLIPEGNLFDFHFYREAIISHSNQINQISQPSFWLEWIRLDAQKIAVWYGLSLPLVILLAASSWTTKRCK
jgi:hypothetical protein